MKYNITCAKLAILDKVMIDELRGKNSIAFATYFQGSFMNDNDLITHAQKEKNMNLLEYVYLRRFFLVRGRFQKGFLILQHCSWSTNFSYEFFLRIFFEGILAR